MCEKLGSIFCKHEVTKTQRHKVPIYKILRRVFVTSRLRVYNCLIV